MTIEPPQLNKTISAADLKTPEIAEANDRLLQFARRLWLKGVPFAVNGVLKRRWRIRWHKRWEYARGLAYGGFKPSMRVLDFGGAATAPVYYLANLGCEVLSLDIDTNLTAQTNATAKKMKWKLTGSTLDLTSQPALAEWGQFDHVISFCVVEHIPKPQRHAALARLAQLLKPGGRCELTFDFGDAAPVEAAIRSMGEVSEMVAATGLTLQGDGKFHDTGERFVLDKKYPDHRFTFGSVFLRKPLA